MSWKRITERGTKDLNSKQLLYVSLYVQTLQGARSAQRSGYSKKSAADRSKDLQRNPKVREAIDKGLAEKERQLKDKCIKTMEHAYAQATADIGDLFDENDKLIPVRKLPRRLRRAISSVEVETRWDGRGEDATSYTVTKVKIHDKRASQELFAKYAGKLRDRLELDATESYADMVLAAQRKREGTETPALPAPADEEPEP